MSVRLGLIALVSLSACGDPASSIKPYSEAGDDQVVVRDATVFLDGSESFDADGELVEWDWFLLSAPIHSRSEILKDEDNPALASFQADRDGEYTLSLQVIDDDGLRSNPDIIRIHAH